MNWNWAWVGAITTLVMGPWNFGMAQERPVIRAQGGVAYPEPYGPIYHEGEYCEECGEEDCRCRPLDKIHHCWRYVFTLGGRTHGYSTLNGRRPAGYGGPGGYAGPGGPGGFGGAGGFGAGAGGRDPRQLDYQNLYRYRAPQDLRYPPANQPAGVVVYPYYTVKGPDDFFLNESLGN